MFRRRFAKTGGYRLDRMHWAGLAFLTATACQSSSTGCAGIDDAPYPHPPPSGGEVQADALSVWVSPTALEGLADNFLPLIEPWTTVEDEQLRFAIDGAPTSSRAPLQIHAGSYIAIPESNLADALTLSWLEADAHGQPGLRVHFEDLQIFLNLQATIDAPPFPLAACRIQSTGQTAAAVLSELSFDLRFEIQRPSETNFGTPPTLRVTSTPQNVGLEIAAPSDDALLATTITPCDGTGSADAVCFHPVCEQPEADCENVCGLVGSFDQLGGWFEQFLPPVANALVDSLFTTLIDGLDQNLQNIPLGFEAALDPEALLPAAFGHLAPLHLKIGASNGFEIRGAPRPGLDIRFEGGATAESAPCDLRPTRPDSDQGSGPPVDYTGFIHVLEGEVLRLVPYDLALGISENWLGQVIRALDRSGLTCFDLTASDVATLTNGNLTFNADLLLNFFGFADLADPDAPLAARVRGTRSPQIRLGAGRRVSPAHYDPLLELLWPELSIDLYMFVDGAYTRVLGTRSDLSIRIDIDRSPEGKVEILLAPEGFKLQNLRTTYYELSLEGTSANIDFAPLLSLAVDTALAPLLAGNLDLDLRANLGDSLGLPFELLVQEVRRDLGETDHPFLSVYGSLCGPADHGNPDHPTCFRPVESGSLIRTATSPPFVAELQDPVSKYTPLDPRTHPSDRWFGTPSGYVRLTLRSEVGPEFAVPEDFEYQTRVGGGLWSSYRSLHQGTLEVVDPRLRMVGFHRVEIRARRPGRPETRSPVFETSFWLDPERPQVFLRADLPLLYVTASDLSRSPVQLLARAYLDDRSNHESASEWIPVSSPSIPRTGKFDPQPQSTLRSWRVMRRGIVHQRFDTLWSKNPPIDRRSSATQ